MKAYIEFIGNEDRRPKTGERFEDENGSIVVACYDHEEIRRMVTRHEIEIPDGATLFQYQTNEGHLYHFYREEGICSYGHFPIPRPKKKVKKCQYITIGTDHCGRKRGEVTGWLTNKEAMERGLEPEDRIYQTEIEVEE